MEVERTFFDIPAGHFFLFGPRGTGKSTLLRRCLPNAPWVDLSSPAEHRRYLARPERLRELVAAAPQGADVVIDEIQRVPEMLVVVHQIMEEPSSPRFVLAGSSVRKLKSAGVDLLAGRAVMRSLHPFTAAELGGRFDFEDATSHGLIPLVWDSSSSADQLNAYVDLCIQQEVQSEGLVRNLGGFHRFLEAVSFSHAAPLNVTEVARDCAVGRKTVEGFVAIIEDLLLAYRLPVFTKRPGRRVTAHPKFYWVDSGLFRALRPSGPLDRPEEIRGAALEGLVAQHIRAWTDYGGNRAKTYYWRTRGGSEVDFVVYGPDELWALEVKHSGRVRPADLRSLRAFREDYPDVRCRLAYLGTERLMIDGVLCLPVPELLQSLVPGEPLP